MDNEVMINEEPEITIKDAYRYDADTKEYAGVVEVQKKPMGEDWLLPQNVTEEEPPAVTEHQVACYIDGEWIVKEKHTLDWYKTNKKSELITARDNEENKPITTDKGKFDFDTLSRTRLLNAMNAMTDLQTREWTTVDKVVVVMHKADFQEIFNTASVRSDEAFAKWKNLKSQVNNATTVEEVQAIKWEEDDG